ncbi:cytochrome P450 [Mycena rosella]|uniref:Cytochrome P450 n=1 Tax=Mycena rosella TaxID=1033263 RepID=A0AAD7DEE9_MYCRO|nr:cytochrome P450 [Mycena rosella]
MAIFHLFAAFLAAWLTARGAEKYMSLRAASRGFGTCPNAGLVWLHPFRTVALILAPWFPLKDQTGYYFAKFAFYAKYGSTCISSVTLSGSIPTLWIADAQAIKTVASESTIFQKDVEAYEALNIYGQNMVGTEGADWKRHRRVANPAFNDQRIRLDRDSARRKRVVEEMNTKLNTDSSLTIDATEDLVQVTLLVIASAGFGRRASWQEDSAGAPPPGHTRAFRAAVSSALARLFTRVLTPQWVWALSTRVRLPLLGPALVETRESFDALRAHMLDLISLARAWVVGGKVGAWTRALRNLVEANMTQADDVHHKKLTDDELLSNIFTFLLAGHETSAHSLSFAVAMLALYPTSNRHIRRDAQGLADGCPTPPRLRPTRNTCPSCNTRSQHSKKQSASSRPSRGSARSRTPTAPDRAPLRPGRTGDIRGATPFTVPVKQGSIVVIDILALHMNPMYWGADAAEFKPARFIDTEGYRWPRDAFFAFSGGARSCIGQRFALAESVCALAMIVRSYTVCLPDHLQGKPLEEQKRVLLRWKPGVTITPTDCVVRLRRRT